MSCVVASQNSTQDAMQVSYLELLEYNTLHF